MAIENLVTQEIRIDKMTYVNGDIDDGVNFWGYVFEKEGKKYLLPSKKKDGSGDIDIQSVLPIFPDELKKVAYKGQVYYLIGKPIPARIKPLEKMSFRELVDSLSSLSHSNKKHQKLMTMVALASVLARLNVRVSTPAAFGQDSSVAVFNSLMGRCNSITNPTVAKLEYLTYSKWLVLNEVVEIAKADWRIIEQFLLDTGDFKTEVTKRSRGEKEILNIVQMSLSIFFNDIDHYADKSKFFDAVTKKAVKDRFLPLRFHGSFEEDFNFINSINIPQYVSENMQTYRDLVHTMTYFKKKITRYTIPYDVKLTINLKQRWMTNLGRLLKVVSLYCSSQEEFDEWVGEIEICIRDYLSMTNYPSLVRNLARQMEVPLTIVDELSSLEQLREYLLSRKRGEEAKYVKAVIDTPEALNRELLVKHYSTTGLNKSLGGYTK